MAHSEDFKKRLYHGCSEEAEESIIYDCFSRSFAGVRGMLCAVGVYFSTRAEYGHGYTWSKSKKERCTGWPKSKEK